MSTPQSPQALREMLINMMITKLYVEITAHGRRHRLSEARIAAIENEVITEVSEAYQIADVFTTFEAEPVIAAALDHVRQFAAACKGARENALNKR